MKIRIPLFPPEANADLQKIKEFLVVEGKNSDERIAKMLEEYVEINVTSFDEAPQKIQDSISEIIKSSMHTFTSTLMAELLFCMATGAESSVTQTILKLQEAQVASLYREAERNR